jgi:hypothetical protein
MDCEQVRSWLVDFADGTVDQGTRIKVQEHLKGCEACRQDLEEIRILFEELGTIRDETPPPSLREGFEEMLHAGMARSETTGALSNEEQTGEIRVRPSAGWSWWPQVAAAVVLVVAGALLDRLVFTGSSPDDGPSVYVTGTGQEELKDLLATGPADGSSPSMRIRTIESVSCTNNPDPQVIDILFTVLNRDGNVNVRYAAARRLACYIGQEEVRTGLIESLAIQEEPLIQITLLNFLVRTGETRAVKVLKQLMYNPENPEIVREEANRAITILES